MGVSQVLFVTGTHEYARELTPAGPELGESSYWKGLQSPSIPLPSLLAGHMVHVRETVILHPPAAETLQLLQTSVLVLRLLSLPLEQFP